MITTITFNTTNGNEDRHEYLFIVNNLPKIPIPLLSQIVLKKQYTDLEFTTAEVSINDDLLKSLNAETLLSFINSFSNVIEKHKIITNLPESIKELLLWL